MYFLFFSQNTKEILKEVAGKLTRDPNLNENTKLSLLMDKLSKLEDYMLTFITIPDDQITVDHIRDVQLLDDHILVDHIRDVQLTDHKIRKIRLNEKKN